MEQFVLVSSSVYCYNKNLNTLAVTKQQLPKYPVEKESHVPNWLAQKGNKQKAVYESRHISRQNVVLSAHQALKFADIIIGWCENSIFTVRFCSTKSSQKRRRSRVFLTVLVYLQLCFWIKMPKPKREEVGCFSKYERQKHQRLNKPGSAAYGTQISGT